MKTYKERTRAVLDKVDEYNKTDNTHVENGGNTLSVRRNKAVILWTAFAAACAAIIIAFNLILFLPFPTRDVSAYKDSEYYGLISVVNGITGKPKYKNNFEKLAAGLKKLSNSKDDAIFDPVAPGVPTAPAAPDSDSKGDSVNVGSGNNGNYVENTNNQVKGVTEADLLKRTDKYTFYLVPHFSGSISLHVYELKGSEVNKISSFTRGPEDGVWDYGSSVEMYLSNDGNTVTVISQIRDKKTSR